MYINPASFRDPAGQVFIRNRRVYRSIFKPGVNDFDAARNAGIFTKLIDAGLLLPYEMMDLPDFAPEGTVHCLSHPRIPMISYPWEWPFSLLKDAALIHLDIIEQLIPQGFWLRDASAFNAQFDGQRLRLIDILSIGKRIPESPWVAYGQFCSHFIAPLAMAAYCDIRTLSLWRNYIDGIPLDLAMKTLPFWRHYQPGLLMHLTLHSRYQDTMELKQARGKSRSGSRPNVSDRGLASLIYSLKCTISGIRWQRSSKIWEAYERIRTYNQNDIVQKSEFVHNVVHQLKPQIVWDLGANTGEFSEIAVTAGAFVVSIDGDPACTEYLYQKVCRTKGLNRILPLTMNLANPSPALGWDSRERLSLRERGPADLVLALALIHHLVFSSCIPLPLIAEWLGTLAGSLIIEFIPPSDPMVQNLLRFRDEHLPYNLDLFQASFVRYFDFTSQLKLQNGRILFLCRQRNKSL